MDVYAEIAVKIIASQEAIIGPVAIEQAKQVRNLEVDWKDKKVDIKGDKVAVIQSLVEKYRLLFGQISVEVSKEAAAPLIGRLPARELPESLK